MWRTHQELLNGTVDHMCQTIFLSEITELTSELQVKCCGHETKMCASVHCMEALKNMRVVWCLCTIPITRSDGC